MQLVHVPSTQSFRFTSSFLAPYRLLGDPFKTLLARSTYLTKYCRGDETWTDTICRVVEGNVNLAPAGSVSRAEAEALYHLFWTGQCLPPGRSLWVGGVEGIPADALFNCWLSVLNGIDDWCWTANQLMLGGGVGVSLNNIGKLPYVSDNPCRLAVHCRADHANVEEVQPEPKEFLNGSTPVLLVEDSRAGWVAGLRAALTAAFEGRDQIIDVSNVRERGKPIKTFGGVACGPGPLAKLLRSVWEVIRSAKGGQLTSLNCLDITNHIGLCIKSGNVRRCLPGNSLVSTQEGLVPIKKIKVGDMVLTSGTKTNKYMPVTACVKQGEQPILAISTQMGTFRCTANHQIAVLDTCATYKFRRASELEPGDRMVFVNNVLPGQQTVLPPWASNTKPVMKKKYATKELILPTLDAEIAWLLGYTLNVGWVVVHTDMRDYGSRVTYTIAGDEHQAAIVARIKAALTRFNLKFSCREPKTLAYYAIEVYSKLFAWYLNGHFKSRGEPVVVPPCILQGTQEVRAAFVAGIVDSGGMAHKEFAKGAIASGFYPEFIRMLQALCASLGIITRIRTQTSGERAGRAVHTLCLSGQTALVQFNQIVRPYSEREMTSLDVLNCDYGYPREMVQLDPRLFAELYSEKQQVSIADYKSLGGDTKGLTPVAVFNVVQETRAEATWDIEVATAEEFVTDGYLVHNSALIVLGSPEDQDFRDSKKSFETVLSHRHTSNNTIAFRSWEQIEKFDWKGLVDDVLQYGEPGIVNMPLIWQTDPTAEGINPCGEAPLEAKSCCNLAEVFPAFFESGTNPEQAFELVTRYTLRQRLVILTDPESNAVSQKSMRLGVGLGGICDFDWTPQTLRDWYTVCRNAATSYAKELGVSRPVTVTTVKPSGTTSLLNGSSPGIHAPYAPYYIRRTRIAKNDPMVLPLIDAGVPFEYDVYDKTENTLVFSFPTKATHTRHTVQTETIREQFERQVTVQENWADNAVSCTLSFKSEEKEELTKCLKEYVPRLKSTSCLSKSHNYPQAPYSSIEKEEYERLYSQINHAHPLVRGGSIEVEECQNGVCPVR